MDGVNGVWIGGEEWCFLGCVEVKYAKTPVNVEVLRGSVLMDGHEKGPRRGPWRVGVGVVITILRVVAIRF